MVPLGETQMYGEGWVGKESCDATSGSELIFQIYLSGNGLEPSEPLQMALSELQWVWVFIIIHHCMFGWCFCLFFSIYFLAALAKLTDF